MLPRLILISLVSASALQAQGAESATPLKSELVATLAPANSRMTGDASVKPGGKGMRVKVSIRNASSQTDDLPWQIRKGSCGENGDVIGAQAAYRVMQVRADQTADVNVNLPFVLDEGEKYSVLVLASRTDMDRMIACGNLTLAAK